MFLPRNTSTSWTTGPYISLPTSNATTSASGDNVPSTKWPLWIILGFIVGLLGLFLAIPGYLHALKQLRLRSAQPEPDTERHPVQQSPAELTTLEPVLKKDSVRSPRSTPPRPLLRDSSSKTEADISVHSGEVMFVSA